MIDLMSCLTAFLLVTAVWVNTAQLNVSAAGSRTNEGESQLPRIGVLVEKERLWLTVSELGELGELGDITELPDINGEHNWVGLTLALSDLDGNSALVAAGGAEGAKGVAVSVAADSTNESPVSYQELISAVDTVNAAGFKSVGITDVAGLALAPQR